MNIKEQIRAEIDKRYAEYRAKMKTDDFTYYEGMADALDLFEQYIDTFPEQPEVDLEKLGEIARHLIAVKDHEEDMRLDESEWLLLERIGYPERFNARKEE